MLLANTLEPEGYAVHVCASAREAIDALEEKSFDLILTDIIMPELSGIDLARYVREHVGYTPVVVMTAYPSLETAKEAIREQALDYLEKPFTLIELRQAVQRGLRRRSAAEETESDLRYGDLVINRASRSVSLRDVPVTLTRREYLTLVLLAEHQGSPVPYEQLLKAVWKTDQVNDHTKSQVKTCVHRLRKKLGDDGRHPHLILTIRDVGYQLGPLNPPQPAPTPTTARPDQPAAPPPSPPES